jgi:hypothetical protein
MLRARFLMGLGLLFMRVVRYMKGYLVMGLSKDMDEVLIHLGTCLNRSGNRTSKSGSHISGR